jgi:helix-turn-helix protein
MRIAMSNKGTMTAAAMTPPLTWDLLDDAAVGVALEDADDVEEVELEVELEVLEVLEVEDVVVDAAVVFGLNVTAVNTVCSFTSAGCPL